jgi:hypothetical protein
MPNDLSRSLAALDLDRTLIAVIEMGASTGSLQVLCRAPSASR